MGRFSKSLTPNIISDWQDSYVYYKLLKKLISQYKKDPVSLEKELFSQMVAQLQRSFSLQKSQLDLFSSQLEDYKINEQESKILTISKLLNLYSNLLSFSLWNLRIITRCLSRLDLIIPKSKSLFISQNSELLKSMQNLSDYKAWLDFFIFEIQKNSLCQTTSYKCLCYMLQRCSYSQIFKHN